MRRIINTKDVYPYAAVIPADADSVLYLPKPSVDKDLSKDQVRRGTPFPTDMPVLEAHAERFRSLLEEPTKWQPLSFTWSKPLLKPPKIGARRE